MYIRPRVRSGAGRWFAGVAAGAPARDGARAECPALWVDCGRGVCPRCESVAGAGWLPALRVEWESVPLLLC